MRADSTSAVLRRWPDTLECENYFTSDKDSLDNVVDTSLDPDVAILVAGGSITEEEVARVRLYVSLFPPLAHLHVSLKVTLVVTKDGTSDRRPRSLGSQNTLNFVALEDLATSRVDDIDVHTKDGEGSSSRLGLDCSWKRSDGDGAGFGHPIR